MYMWNHVEYTMECEGKAGLSQTFWAKFPPGIHPKLRKSHAQ